MPAKRFDLSPFLAKIAKGMTTSDYSAGQVIFRQGTKADVAGYLVSGVVKQVAFNSRHQVIVELLEPGDLFGTEGLEGRTRASSAIAVKASSVIRISNAAIRELMMDAAFAQMFMVYLLETNNRIEAEKAALLLNPAEKLLAQRLLALAHARSGAVRLIGPEITQEMLADMIGSTRTRVNFFMTKFRKLGLIKYSPNNAIEIDAEQLDRIVQEGK